MGSLVFVFVSIGVVCGIFLTIGIVLSALVRSNNIGQDEMKEVSYIDYTTLSYHAIYDSQSGINHFDGNYKN